MPTAPKIEPPSRRGWIVLAATFMTQILIYGVWYGYSVFLVSLLREFGWSRSLVSGAFSTFVMVHGLLGPLIGWLLRRFGPRHLIMTGAVLMCVAMGLMAETTQWWHLYVAFGVIAAFAMSLAGWIPSVVLVGGWFPDRYGTAIGIMGSGIGVSIFALVPLAQVLIETFGWRWAYRILGLAVVAWVLPATLYLVRDPPSGDPPTVGGTSGRTERGGSASGYWTLASAARTWQFWGVAGVFFTGNFVTQMLLIHQVAYLVDHGVPIMTAAALGGAVGLVSIAGKIGWGALSDRTSRLLAYSLAFACVAASVGGLVLAGWYPTSYLPYLYAILIGIGYAAMAPVPPALANDLFAGPGFSMIFSAMYTVGGLGLAAGTWSAGWIFDASGSYAGALWLGLIMAVVSPLLMWLVAWRDLPRRAGVVS
ncbi:MAG: permease of the major facilitator superfamily [candidate division NC10 bacterium]|nr:permease of the major facilitator superfamily [candidate division NC10 bacterium]